MVLLVDDDEQTEVQGFSEGATDFIRKPMRKAVAVQRMNRILELSYLQKNLKQEVEKGSGSQFDPKIAEVMMTLIKEDKKYLLHE